MTNRRIIVSIVLIAIMLMPSAAFAGTKSMTVYDNAYKTKSTVFCNTGYGIYKVNLTDASKVRLAKNSVGVLSSMKVTNGRLYYIYGTQGTMNTWSLYRVKTTGKDRQKLAKGVERYAISGSKLYYGWWNSNDKYKKGVMKLDGKSKKTTSNKIRMTNKKTNTSSYYVYEDDSNYDWDEYDGYISYYLITPSKSIFLQNVYDVY